MGRDSWHEHDWDPKPVGYETHHDGTRWIAYLITRDQSGKQTTGAITIAQAGSRERCSRRAQKEVLRELRRWQLRNGSEMRAVIVVPPDPPRLGPRGRAGDSGAAR